MVSLAIFATLICVSALGREPTINKRYPTWSANLPL